MTAAAKEKYKIARREEMREDYTIDQIWEDYSDDDHAIWRELFEQVSKSIEGRACSEYIDGLKEFGDLIGVEGVPRFDRLTDILMKKTGWQIVAVPGAIPGSVFFNHLANRRFPVTDWIRSREQMGYLKEPDAFHDITGHAPLLLNPVFADYMEAFGKGGVRAKELGGLRYLGRLYWYTVEFGLIKSKRDKDQLRIYGAGILSSTAESKYSLESDIPQRVAFNMERMMRTDFHITDMQELYFVIDSFEQLFEATHEDFASYYEKLAGSDAYTPQDTVDDDIIVQI